MEAQGKLLEDHGDVKIWTYAEAQSLISEIPTGSCLPEKPSFWPVDVDVDPGRWMLWLPVKEGWGQGLRTTPSGKVEKKFISPEGKKCNAKEDVEKACGRTLSV